MGSEVGPTGHPDERHARPPGADDATVSAVGTVSEALEWVERARGRLYDFHQMMGRADLTLGQAADELEQAGHAELAEAVRSRAVGRNVLEGRWTFQIVEEFDDGYYAAITEVERQVRDALMAGRRHVFESEMKERRRTDGAPGHDARP